jgi:hypothetical protein
MEWFLNNKEWIFSGIGVFLLGLIINIVFRKKSIKQIQKSGKNSKNYQAGGDINIGRKL